MFCHVGVYACDTQPKFLSRIRGFFDPRPENLLASADVIHRMLANAPLSSKKQPAPRSPYVKSVKSGRIGLTLSGNKGAWVRRKTGKYVIPDHPNGMKPKESDTVDGPPEEEGGIPPTPRWPTTGISVRWVQKTWAGHKAQHRPDIAPCPDGQDPAGDARAQGVLHRVVRTAGRTHRGGGTAKDHLTGPE